MKLKFKSTKLHILLSVFWALMLLPTLIWFKDSILWVSGMSLYALVIGHISSYEAAASAGVDEATHSKLNAIADSMADLMEVAGLKEDAEELRRVVGLENRED